LNHIDLEESERRGIQIISLRGETAFLKEVRATAELTLALTLALLRKIPAAVKHTAEGNWNREFFCGREIFDKTVGIVGYGRLGQIVARYFSALGAQVLAIDPGQVSGTKDETVKFVDRSGLLAESDIVTLHVNLSKENVRFFDSSWLRKMKSGAWLINTARGELLDEEALVQELESGHLGGAALDVVCNEHDGGFLNRPLFQYAKRHSNLLLAPHIGGFTVESMEKTEVFLARKLQRFLSVGCELA
jgi:D-3-phosphoglycerate dehydrogenase